MNNNNQDRSGLVTLSAAKGLTGQVARSFAALRMTRPALVGKIQKEGATYITDFGR